MKKTRIDSYVLMAIIAVMLLFIALAIPMEYRSSKLLPILFGSVIVILAIIQLAQELKKGNKRQTRPKAEPEREQEVPGGSYMLAWGWTAGFVIGVFLIGFLVSIPLFIIAYMKLHGSKWPVSLITAVVTTAAIYGIFEVALRVELYRGLLPM